MDGNDGVIIPARRPDLPRRRLYVAGSLPEHRIAELRAEVDALARPLVLLIFAWMFREAMPPLPK